MTISNSINSDAAKRWLGEALRVYDELEDLKVSNMNQARIIRSRLPGIYESAKGEGLPIKALKTVLKEELIKRKIAAAEAAIEALEPDDDEDAETLEQFRAALGDFADSPLGKAAVDQKAAGDDDSDLRPRHLKEAEAQRVEENKRRLKDGIKGLPGAEATEA